MTFDRRRVWEYETFALATLHTQGVLSSSAGTLHYDIQRLIGHSLGKAYSVLSTQICWKSPNLNYFEIKWSENFNIKLELYLYPGAVQ